MLSAFFVGSRRIRTHANTSKTVVNVPAFKKRILQIQKIKDSVLFFYTELMSYICDIGKPKKRIYKTKIKKHETHKSIRKFRDV